MVLRVPSPKIDSTRSDDKSDEPFAGGPLFFKNKKIIIRKQVSVTDDVDSLSHN